MLEDVHERVQAPVAPAHDADTPLVDEVVGFQHEVARGVGVLHLEAAVVDGLVEALPVAGAAPVFGRHDCVALSHKLAKDVQVEGVEVAVDAAVRQHDQRNLLARRPRARQEGVGAHDEGVAGALSRGVRLVVAGRPGEQDLVDLGDVVERDAPHHVVDGFRQAIEGVTLIVLAFAEATQLAAQPFESGRLLRVLRPEGRRHQGASGRYDEET